MHEIFIQFRKAANLKLKPRKYVVVLLVAQANQQVIDTTRVWLKRHCREWADVQITTCAKYLGVFLGPAAGAKQWVAPMEKFLKRCIDLRDSDQPALMAIRNFNTKVLPVLGYVAQMIPPPKNMTKIELTAILRVLNLAGQSMNTDAAYQLKQWLGLDPKRPRAYMESAM